MKHALVTGAGGFIGHHLVKSLVGRGYWVRGVDIKVPEYETSQAHEFELLDLRRWDSCLRATRQVDEVFNLAANMGGIGFIHAHKAEIMHDNVLINTHMLEAARENGVDRRSEEHTSELQSLAYLVCRLLLEKKKKNTKR